MYTKKHSKINFPQGSRLVNFNVEKYNFSTILQTWFNWRKNLQQLHLQQEYITPFSREKDQSTLWHTIFYKKIREDINFLFLYYDFLKTYIKPLYKDTIIFQTIPCLRIHLPKNVAVGEFHKDKDYRDKEWAEKVVEKNYFLPLTKTNKHNTIWVESVENKQDYRPILIDPGMCLEWDGSNLSHGNKQNISNSTRVSLDFRVIDFNNYIESNKGSINTNTKFKIGEYYSIL